MIIHYNHDKPVSVYVVNSRLPVYRAYYGDCLGSPVAGLFTRIAPKVAPLVKQLSMKAIDVIRDKGISAVGNLTSRAFSTARDKITSLVRNQRDKQRSLALPSTAVMPAKISKAINNAPEEKLVTPSSANSNQDDIAIMIAGSGLKLRRR